jgi:hypothetical protein
MVNMVLSGKQATGYLPAGGEYQISALRVGGSLPVGGQGTLRGHLIKNFKGIP